MREKLVSLDFWSCSSRSLWRIRNGIRIDNVSLRLYFWATGSFSTAFGAHTGIGTMPITLYGSEEQNKNMFKTGWWFGAYCLTEPGAGSDANSGKTKAVLSEDGKYYTITGQKKWISNAGFCSVFIVFSYWR
jgi:alkylation response protein AidB-like acyl-CoA dehydrogenase